MFKIKQGKHEASVDIKYPVTTVTFMQPVCINNEWITYFGRGKAACNSEDKFNKDFGQVLAGVRAQMDILKTIEEDLIDLTKDKAWRKTKDKKDKDCVSADVVRQAKKIINSVLEDMQKGK